MSRGLLLVEVMRPKSPGLMICPVFPLILPPDEAANTEYVAALMNRYQLISIVAPDPFSPDGMTRVTPTYPLVGFD